MTAEPGGRQSNAVMGEASLSCGPANLLGAGSRMAASARWIPTAKGLYVALWAFLICGFCGVVVEMTFCYAQQY